MSHGSTKAVVTAIIGNSLVTVAKFVGFMFSGSSALLAEAVHSLADTANQALLYLGLKRSQRVADGQYHFGYGQERYFWNLVSAVTIFFLGCIYTMMHALGQLEGGHEPEMSWLVFAILAFAFVVEGYSLWVAYQEFTRQRLEKNMGFMQYVKATRDPTTLAVLIEDTVAVLGLVVALVGMSLAAYTGSALFDIGAAMIIAMLMGLLAFFLAATNKKYLLNVSDETTNAAALKTWSADPRVQNVHHVHSIVLSPDESIVMAEVELCEETLFSDMSEAEIQQAVRFMKRLDTVRLSLEAEVRQQNDEAKHIYLEFTGLPEDVQKSNKEE
ncbi:MAG: cation transporter [Mariprofundaceae bacterium]|nr:cation transporter [Mariprofundaceae bacterium]